MSAPTRLVSVLRQRRRSLLGLRGGERELNADGRPSLILATPLLTSTQSRVIGSTEGVHAGGII